jgi:F0F1-type ATP synthase alpha subunit
MAVKSAIATKIAVFSARVVFNATELMATAGIRPALTIGFSVGCFSMKAAIGGLTL